MKMSSAQQVCGFLKVEHSVLRQALGALAELADGGADALPLPRVRLLMEFIDQFDRHGHGAREAGQLIDALRDKSPEAGRLLQALQQVRDGCDEEFDHALGLLHAAEHGAPDAAAALADLLPHYRGVMLRLLRAEEELLYELATRLLDDDDWSRIAAVLLEDDPPGARPPRTAPRVVLQTVAAARRGG